MNQFTLLILAAFLTIVGKWIDWCGYLPPQMGFCALVAYVTGVIIFCATGELWAAGMILMAADPAISFCVHDAWGY